MDLSNPVTAVIPSLEGRVLVVLSRMIAPLSGSRIAELVPGASNPGVRAALARLVAQGTVHAERSSHAVLYTANRDHLAWPAVEAAVLLATQVRTLLGQRIAAVVSSHFGATAATRVTVALFGSVARGTSDGSSDVDLVLLTPDDFDDEDVERLILDLSRLVELWTGNRCSIYEVTPSSLADLARRDDPMLRSWSADAITIYGPEIRRLLPDGGTR